MRWEVCEVETMNWIMILVVNFSVVQIGFESELLCEDAKAKLVKEHKVKPINISCLKVKEARD